MSELEKFLEERSKIPIPSGDATWVKLLAKELAIGANRNLWSPRGILMFMAGGARAMCDNATKYFEQRWRGNDLDHLLEVLLAHEYFIKLESNHPPKLTTNAFDLIEEVEPHDVFISYRRLDSSALALLVLARLKEHDLVPFCDMALEAGGNWHADLKERITDCDYFIILLGNDTLASEMTVKEICWAIDGKRTIIPIWHSGFGLAQNFDLSTEMEQFATKWKEEWLRNRRDELTSVINRTNAIRVLDESASGYNTAIVELLNRFGITP